MQDEKVLKIPSRQCEYRSYDFYHTKIRKSKIFENEINDACTHILPFKVKASQVVSTSKHAILSGNISYRGHTTASPLRNQWSTLHLNCFLKTVFLNCKTHTQFTDLRYTIKWSLVHSQLYDHHHDQCQNIFITPENLCTHWQSLYFPFPPSLQVNTNLLSISTGLLHLTFHGSRITYYVVFLIGFCNVASCFQG